MLLPSKHINFAESILGLAGFLLPFLKEEKTLDELWKDFGKINKTKKFPAYHNFDNVVLAVDFLFIIGAIGITPKGKIQICA